MATGREIEKRGHVIGFRDEIDKAALSGREAFFTWFDKEDSADIAFIRGSWDFMVHIAMPIARYISSPESKTVLEIGYGGGRLLAAASKSFGSAIGIDVHDHLELVRSELDRRGATGFNLLKTNGSAIPMGPSSVDVVYSFIVFQHLEKISIFNGYIEESYRILRPGGVAILYFGRHHVLSSGKSSESLYRSDCQAEEIALGDAGFLERPARVNQTNLIVAPWYAKRSALSVGFDVVEQVVSHKHVPDGVALYGGQHGLILRKNS